MSLGVGAMQINGGLNYLFGVPNNKLIQGIIILIVTVLFLISAWSGLSKGIQYLSNLNMLLVDVTYYYSNCRPYNFNYEYVYILNW